MPGKHLALCFYSLYSLEEQDISQAAVCSEHAAELYGLQILARKINFESDNSTRFIIVTNQKIFLKNARKFGQK